MGWEVQGSPRLLQYYLLLFAGQTAVIAFSDAFWRYVKEDRGEVSILFDLACPQRPRAVLSTRRCILSSPRAQRRISRL